ncbi:unnamed protein product, partial [Lymnaea stagnalis]
MINEKDADCSEPNKERKFSARLAKKRKNKLQHSVTNDLNSNQATILKPEINDKKEDHEKVNDSKFFLDCLELKPVNDEAITSCEQTDSQDSEEPIKCSVPKKVKDQSKSSDSYQTKPIKVRKKLKSISKLSKKPRSSKKKKISESEIEDVSDVKIEDNKFPETAVESGEAPCVVSENVNGEKCSKPEPCHNSEAKENISVPSAIERIKSRKQTGTEIKSDETSQQIYIFRDLNKKVSVDGRVASQDDQGTNDLFAAVDLNRHGKKRRYDKLMKKLEDGEKTIESNMKEVKLLEDDEIEKEDIDHCVEKLKEKLRVREKKKYEYLINYMRDQWKVEKSFQDLL